jgi:hypothetical protein
VDLLLYIFDMICDRHIENSESHSMLVTDKDILTKEIGSWGDFGYALRMENRILFEEMLDR